MIHRIVCGLILAGFVLVVGVGCGGEATKPAVKAGGPDHPVKLDPKSRTMGDSGTLPSK
jgi:hypothetical protein